MGVLLKAWAKNMDKNEKSFKIAHFIEVNSPIQRQKRGIFRPIGIVGIPKRCVLHSKTVRFAF